MIRLTSGELLVTNNLSIIGPGPANSLLILALALSGYSLLSVRGRLVKARPSMPRTCHAPILKILLHSL